MGDEEGASPEAKLGIATYFIMSSPTAEVNDVVKDVEKLVADPATLTAPAIEKMLRAYNVEQLAYAADPTTGAAVMVSAHNEIDATHYQDPNSGRVCKFDHRTIKFTDSVEKKVDIPDKVNKFRAATQKALDAYVDGTYKEKDKKVAVSVFGSAAGVLTICISAKNVNLGSFWTGSWRSVWTISVEKAGASELKGNIKTNVHYFEDGNVQLNSKLDRLASVAVGSEDATAAEITKQIGKQENDFQVNLEEMYVKMHSTTFKSMRRFYPVTRQAMLWNPNAHNLANEVGKAGP
jgi:capping protein alpha